MVKDFMTRDSVVVLNNDFTFINIVDWQKAHKLVSKGKAEILKTSNDIVKNFEGTYKFSIPTVIKLVNFIKSIYKNQVPFNKKNLFIRDRYKCCYCGCAGRLTIDHVNPVSKGGETSWFNCVSACNKCNSKKSNKTLEQIGFNLKVKPYQPNVVQFLKIKAETFGIGVALEDLL